MTLTKFERPCAVEDAGLAAARRSGEWTRIACLGLLLGTAAWPALAQAGDAAAGQPAPSNLQEVVVTARKVRERLQDVPISVSAVSGEQFKQADHRRIEDLNLVTPNANIEIINGHQTSLSIRGLGNNPANDGLESSAGVFLDGVYMGRPGMAAQDLIDLDQIEVLRGPQGTLFGKNTTAGAVNISTAPPSLRFGAQGQVSFGNYGYQQYQGAVTGPLIGDVLAGRLTAYKTDRGGVVDDIATHDKVNTLGREGVRGQLLYRPNDDFSLRLIGDYAQENQSTGAVVLVPSLGVTPQAVKAKLAVTNAVIAIDPNGLTTAVDGATTTGTRQSGFSGEANWKVGGFTLTSITAYRSWLYHSLSDADGASADVINGGYNLTDSQWSEELRVAFPHMGPVDAVAGLYYFEQQVRSDQVLDYGAEAAAWLTGIPDALLPVYARSSPALAGVLAYNRTRWDTISTPHTQSYAAFGQAIWHATDRWNLTLGLRATYETVDETVRRPNPVSSATGQPVAALASSTAAPIAVGVRNTAPAFLISTDYHIAPGLMAYGFVSRGEKAGGANAALPAAGAGPDSLKVKPETATDYELGIKGQLFGNRLILNGGLFRTDVQDYQASYFTVINNVSVQILSNAGKAITQGAELEATAVPLAGLTLHATGGYDEAYYGAYRNAPCPAGVAGASCDLTGRPIMGAPRWTANTYGAYEHAIPGGLIAYGRVEYSWRSQFYGSPDDASASLTGNYGLTNLYLGIRDPKGRWDIMLWGKNVANVHYAYSYSSGGTILPGLYTAVFGDPGAYGVTLRTAF